MPVMSADVRETSIAAALDVRQTPEASLHAPAAAPIAGAPADPGAATGSGTKTTRLMILGYLFLIAGTVLVYFIPRFRLSPGLVESAVVLISMISVITGAIIAIAAFIWPLLRR